MSEQFLTDDPPTSAQRRRLDKHFEQEIGDLMRSARKAKVVGAIGTSGTINTLVAMARAQRGEELGRLHGAHASAAEVARLARELCTANAALRIDLPGIDTKRSDLMPAAGMLADFVMRKSGAADLTACTWALREGLLLGLAGKTSGRSATEARRRSVTTLARRFCGVNDHGRQVARLALKLFDATALLLGLPPAARELLEYGSLLHDVGHAIDHDRHHRHSYYLIKNAELLGFTPAEIEVIAQAARGHRKQAPSLDSTELRKLNAGGRRMVRGIAAILRVADALDRSHFGIVRAIDVRYLPGRMIIEVAPNREHADLELWTGERRADLLSKLLDRRVILHQ